MPRETIRKLHEDVGRILVAGAHLASGDPELSRDKEGLEKLAAQLGAKAPVIGQLAEAVKRALSASDRDATREVIGLATMTVQVRAAQATLATPKGEEQPLQAVPEIGTPCNARDIYDLREALVSRGQGRMEKISAAVERGDIADLRLVDAVVEAMGDPWIGEKVTTEAVPLLGRAIVAPIRARLRIKDGKAVDGRRLRALVAVERHEAKALLEQAVREGSAEVREGALDAIADYLPGQSTFEPLALELIARERAGDVKRAAVRALSGFGSDASLDALLKALDAAATRSAAAEALGSSTHKAVVDRLLEKLGETLSAAAENGGKTKKKAAATGKAKKGDKEAEERRSLVIAILNALTPHTDGRIAARSLELLDGYGATAARAVVQSGNAKQLAAVADLLSGKDVDAYYPAVAAAMKLGPDEAYKRLSAVFTSKDRDSKEGKRRLDIVGRAVGESKDVRWVDFLLGVLEKAYDKPAKEGVAAVPAMNALGELGDRRATPLLIKVMQNNKGRDSVYAAISALSSLGDPAALDPMLEMIKRHENWSWALRWSILQIADESTVDKVRTIVAGIKDIDAYKYWPLRNVLETLERRYPGA